MDAYRGLGGNARCRHAPVHREYAAEAECFESDTFSSRIHRYDGYEERWNDAIEFREGKLADYCDVLNTVMDARCGILVDNGISNMY